jgi:hypothetical protein
MSPWEMFWNSLSRKISRLSAFSVKKCCSLCAVLHQDHVLELVGDGGVDPQYDVDVRGAPLVGGKVRRGLLLHMLARIVLGEYEQEQVSPLVVVAGSCIETELDVFGDVNSIGGGWRR